MQVEERFLKYVAVDTQSEVGHDNNPSTPGQWDLARLLVEELKALGVSDARVDEHCYVMEAFRPTCRRASLPRRSA